MMTAFGVDERTSCMYTATLTDEAGVVFNGAAFATLTLTLYDVSTDTILNSRNAQNVLNANGVTVSGAGVLTWLLDPEDTAMVTASASRETHVALFTGTWNPGGGVRTWRHEVAMIVTNLHRVS